MRVLFGVMVIVLLTAAAVDAAQIERFAFDSRAKMGVGGFITVDVYPVVLFRNGDALTDVKGLSFPGGTDAHKREHPAQWTKWRHANGEWQLQGKDGWKALPFKQTYTHLPADFRLKGRYRSLSGAGNVAMGGGQSVAAWSHYEFTADGRVVRGSGAGGRAESSGTVTAQARSPDRTGRYRIEGLKLTITYDDKSVEQRILITNPDDPESSIWLDGVGYAFTK
jgi:hypothetical protein